MAEWLFEAGIGEARAALVSGGKIVKARIELPGGLRVGTIGRAQLVERVGSQLLVRLENGAEAMLACAPPGISLGRSVMVEIVREAIPEPGRAKRARAVLAPDGALATDGPSLLARLTHSGAAVQHCLSHGVDLLEAAGWSEVLDEAISGSIPFPGGALRLSPTPAMTLFDVDGSGISGPLAISAATACAAAIVRFDIGGSIGIDFPSVAGRAARAAVAAAIDAALPQPFERTALNGFGFLQIIRRRSRASLPELLRADPVAAAGRAALRHIARTPPGAEARLRLAPAVTAWLRARPNYLNAALALAGAPVMLED